MNFIVKTNVRVIEEDIPVFKRADEIFLFPFSMDQLSVLRKKVLVWRNQK